MAAPARPLVAGFLNQSKIGSAAGRTGFEHCHLPGTAGPLCSSPPNTWVDIQTNLAAWTIAAEAVVLYCHRFSEGPFGETGRRIKFAQIAPRDQEFFRLYMHDEIAPQ
jgi:hypothetical protein